MIRPSSSNVQPTHEPCPAAVSRSVTTLVLGNRGVDPIERARDLIERRASTPAPMCAPGCRTTAWMPRRSARSSSSIIAAIDLRETPRSSWRG